MKKLKFNTDMAQAVKDGRKTMTRRPIKENLKGYKFSAIQGFQELAAVFWNDETDEHKSFFVPIPYKIGDTHDVDGTQIKITDIRVERLQDISEEDAIAEGSYSSRVRLSSPHLGTVGKTAIENYEEEIWNPLPYKPPYDWNSNPYVWVIEFEKKGKAEVRPYYKTNQAANDRFR